MPKFGKKSLENIETIDKKLKNILFRAIEIVDFSVLEGYRTEEKQNKYFKDGSSKLKYPESKHNYYPSRAVDIAPYPINWNDIKRFYFLAGVIESLAIQEGVKIRWGGDWDNDKDFSDQHFKDLPHFELI